MMKITLLLLKKAEFDKINTNKTVAQKMKSFFVELSKVAK